MAKSQLSYVISVCESALSLEPSLWSIAAAKRKSPSRIISLHITGSILPDAILQASLLILFSRFSGEISAINCSFALVTAT